MSSHLLLTAEAEDGDEASRASWAERQGARWRIRRVPGGGRLDADQAVTVLYDTHYRALTQLAALLVSDVALAEEIVQDAFIAIHGARQHLGDAAGRCPTCSAR